MTTESLNRDAGAAPSMGDVPAPPRTRRVIDAPTRALHWLLAAAFAGAWLTGEVDGLRAVHATLGYVAAGLVAARLLWGLVGPRPARLSLLVRRLAGLPAWLRGPFQGRGNPAQAYGALHALAALAILALVLGAAAAGIAAFNFAPTEGLAEVLGEVHEALANAALVVVLAHIALVAGAAVFLGLPRWRAMLTGRLPGAGPDLAPRNRGAWALLLIGAVLAFLSWQYLAGEARWAQPGPGAQLAFAEHGEGGGDEGHRGEAGGGARGDEEDDDD